MCAAPPSSGRAGPGDRAPRRGALHDRRTYRGPLTVPAPRIRIVRYADTRSAADGGTDCAASLLDGGGGLSCHPVRDRAQPPLRALEHRDVTDVVRLLVAPPRVELGDPLRRGHRDEPVTLALQHQDGLPD